MVYSVPSFQVSDALYGNELTVPRERPIGPSPVRDNLFDLCILYPVLQWSPVQVQAIAV